MAIAELSIVVPTYKERGNVAELVRRLDAALTGIAWEAIYVDDNSPDGTTEAVKAIAASDPRVREAAERATQALRERQQLTERHRSEAAALHGRVLSGTTPSTLARAAAKLRQQAEHDRADLAQLEALPIGEAANRVRRRAAQAEAERAAVEQARAALEARAARLGHTPAQQPDRGRSGPERDTGPSL